MEVLSRRGTRPLSEEAALGLLGINGPVPLTIEEMARKLTIAYMPSSSDPRLDAFRESLTASFNDHNVPMVEFTEILNEKGRVSPGITQISFGEGKAGELGIDHVSTLYNNPIVGVLYKPTPVSSDMSPQQILDILSADFVWHMVHIVIYVTEDKWTCCTMNGSIVSGGYDPGKPSGIAEVLIPKLAAPIKPLRKKDFKTFATEESSLGNGSCSQQIEDMIQAATLFRENGMFPSQTSSQTLSYRTKRYRRIGADFLDNRTGMSYGFIARQLPSPVRPALPLGPVTEAGAPAFEFPEDISEDGSLIVCLDGIRYAVEVPDVAVLCTRSGCNKGNIDPKRDIVKLTLESYGGMSFFATKDVSEAEAKPSYDTMVIFSHAISNAIIASVLAHLNPQSEFLRVFTTTGVAIAHWHEHLTREDIPPGFTFHGDTNPAVSCASPQAALFALQGKLQAFADMDPEARLSYRGDVHVEPHHGTNVVDSTLVSIGEWSAKLLDGVSGR